MSPKTKPPKITAQRILELLIEKHSSDVFIPECKDGPSQFRSHNRMDGWAMKKSWASPLTIVYEIKVSRNDFMQDIKWRAYLPCGNEFYFVCPTGLIDTSECPEEAGLMYVSRTGNRLYTKKKSPYRDIKVPEEVYRYILMSRVVVGREYEIDLHHMRGRQYWERWLESKKEDAAIGARVSQRITQMAGDEIVKTRRENERLKSENDDLQKFKRAAEELGIDLRRTWDIRRRVKELTEEAIPESLLRKIRSARESLERVEKNLTEEKMEVSQD